MKKLIVILLLVSVQLFAEQLTFQYMLKGDSPYMPDSLFGKELEIVHLFNIVNDPYDDPYSFATPKELFLQSTKNFVVAKLGDREHVFLVGDDFHEMEIGDSIKIYSNKVIGKDNISHLADFESGFVTDVEQMYFTILNGGF